MQTAPRKLEPELVECLVAHDGVVLEDSGEIARLVYTRPRAGVLAKDLILRRGLEPGHRRRGHTYSQKRIIVVVPALFHTRRPQACFFGDWKVPSQRSQRNERCRQWRYTRGDDGAIRPHRSRSVTDQTINLLSCRARHGKREFPQPREGCQRTTGKLCR